MSATLLDIYGQSVPYLSQWDYNQKLVVSDIYSDVYSDTSPSVQFCNKNSAEALVVSTTVEDGRIIASIPNSLLQEPYDITAYIVLVSSDAGKVIVSVHIPVRKRARPSSYEYADDADIIDLANIIKEVDDLNTEANELYISTKSYAVGGTGTRSGEDTDNAKYYYEKSKTNSANAKNSADLATTSASAAANSASGAAKSATNASASETAAKESATIATESATSASNSAASAEKYAELASSVFALVGTVSFAVADDGGVTMIFDEENGSDIHYLATE